VGGLKHQSMDHFAGLEVSAKDTSPGGVGASGAFFIFLRVALGLQHSGS
jgi:hypothetical protein